MLTPEERQRIEDEERKRIAEEEYRAEVRAKLQVEPEKKTNWAPALIGGGIALVIAFFVALPYLKKAPQAGGDDSPTATAQAAPPQVHYVPVSQSIANGQVIVKAHSYVQYRLTITPEMNDPTVTGNFNASGGAGNDIEAVIADEPNYTNWVNGHQAQVLWSTGGKETTGNIIAKLQPGMYYLVFSNKFSAFTDKQVFLNVSLNYSKAE